MNDFIVKHLGLLVAVLSALVIAAAGVTVWLVIKENNVEDRLGPSDKVSVVGPCRTFGPDNPECRRQSRRIIRSCLTHRDCLSLIDRLIRRAQRQGLQPDRPADDGDRGGGDPSSNPHSTSGNGLGGGSDAPDLPPIDLPPIPVGPNPPSQHPSPLEEITDEVTETVCESWDGLMPPQVPDPVDPLVCP